MSTANETLNTIETLVTKGLITNADLTEFANSALAEHGVALSDAPAKVVKRKARKAKPAAGKNKRAKFVDGMTNKVAILTAIKELGECKSKELKKKLVEMNHPIAQAVFHTQLSNLISTDKHVKSKGPLRHNVYSLTAKGEKALEEAQA